LNVRHVSIDQRCDRKILALLNDVPEQTVAIKARSNLHEFHSFRIDGSFASHASHFSIESRSVSLRSRKTTLEHLSIINFPLNDDGAFKEMCRCTRLKVLKVFLGNESCHINRAVSRLEKLEELAVKSAAKFGEGQLATF
jgi:hypothetical protein